MERKIGEIFEYNGEWYQCVESDSCGECSLFTTECGSGTKSDLADKVFGLCSKVRRSNNKHVIFKKLEKVGEPYPLYGHIVQRYIGVTDPVVLPKEPFVCCNVLNNTVDIEVKQQNPNTEDMEAKEKTMPVRDGWEFDRIDDSGNIVLKEKKKGLPETWEECLKVVDKTEYITNDCEIYDGSIEKLIKTFGGIADTDRNLLPLGLGKPMLALCQLLICRNAWWKQLGWKPDWSDKNKTKYCIGAGWNEIEKDQTSYAHYILAFPTSEVRDQFLDTFRDLIEEAKELL